MKKIFTTLAASLLCSSAVFADITVTNGGTTVANGSTISLTEGVVDDYGDAAIIEIGCIPVITSSAAPITIKAITTDSKIQVCPSSCIDLKENNGKYEGSMVEKKSSVDCRIHREWVYPDEVDSKTVPADYSSVTTIEITDNAGANFTFSIDMNPGGAGIGAIETAKAFSFSDNVLSYSLTQSADLAVYSITGSKVLGRTLSGSGTVDFGRLPRGLYIYSAAGHTAKVLVR